MTHTPGTITYFSVVSRETVCIALTMAALLELEVKAADVLNAFVTAPNCEKILMVLGPEFGDNDGKCPVIVKALYSLKSAGAFLGHTLHNVCRNQGAVLVMWILTCMLCACHFMYPS